MQDGVGLLCVEGGTDCGPVCTLTSTWRKGSIAGLRRRRCPHVPERVWRWSVPLSHTEIFHGLSCPVNRIVTSGRRKEHDLTKRKNRGQEEGPKQKARWSTILSSKCFWRQFSPQFFRLTRQTVQKPLTTKTTLGTSRAARNRTARGNTDQKGTYYTGARHLATVLRPRHLRLSSAELTTR